MMVGGRESKERRKGRSQGDDIGINQGRERRRGTWVRDANSRGVINLMREINEKGEENEKGLRSMKKAEKRGEEEQEKGGARGREREEGRMREAEK